MANYRRYNSANAAHAAEQGTGNAPSGKKNSKRSGGVWRVIFWLALVVLIGAVGVLGAYLWGYYSSNQTYENLAGDVTKNVGSADDNVSLADMTINWDALRKENPDIVAWVYIPGTRVNYPVVQGKDNEKYLHTLFDGSTGFNNSGTVFMDAANSSDVTDNVTFLYGHHMRDGSMFADVDKYSDSSFFNSHRYVYVLTPKMNYRAKAFSVVLAKGTEAIVQPRFASDAKRTAYIKDKEDRSVVTPQGGMPKASSVDAVFALCTCDYTQEDGRAVLYTEVVDTAQPGSGDSSTASSNVSSKDAKAVDSASKKETK